ncbi:MAG: hypothetical protein ACRC7N_11515 [Clostridium sp.]
MLKDIIDIYKEITNVSREVHKEFVATRVIKSLQNGNMSIYDIVEHTDINIDKVNSVLELLEKEEYIREIREDGSRRFEIIELNLYKRDIFMAL